MQEKNYQCSKCPSKFSSWSDRNKHFNQVHDNLWPCEICKRVFKAKEKLARHELIHSDLKNFVCIFCEHRSRTLPNLMSHIGSVHTREKPFPCAGMSSRELTERKNGFNKCSLCDKKFPTNQLTVIKNSHRRKTIHLLLFWCDKNFLPRRINAYKFSRRRKKYICSICGNGFVTTDMLNQMPKYTNKSFHAIFAQKCSPQRFLKVHQKSHSEHRQFKCEECPSSFFIKGQLNNHVRKIHRKLRPFPCSMCDRSFYRAGQRDKHLSATHLNEQAYKCDICDRRFKSGTSVHIKQHNQLTDLNCAVCPKRFLTRTDLLEHHLKQHVGKNYDLLTCVFCNYKFHKIRPLENHMNRHTRETSIFLWHLLWRLFY
ncbi:putative zinc finger protein [Orchesella cincta]|uniref:Putative zinc finger protein n=1 Tax=Orchesella cincta TaxID=48709 RepID=A0A1D2M1E2_ORCCI|nr:putative zinc finger protein [Orchesella cincta]